MVEDIYKSLNILYYNLLCEVVLLDIMVAVVGGRHSAEVLSKSMEN